MEIVPYKYDPAHLAELVDVINFCQNIEAKLGITMAEQNDVFQIEDYYQAKDGQFWLALEDNRVVGCIALLPIDATTGVLKKFFTYPEFRGQPHRLGAKLYEQFIIFAQTHGFKRIVLDTPAGETRSHAFYEKNGFVQITPAELNASYAFPDRNSKLYEKKLVSE